ncbi:MAG TPA: hypothetical protein VF283_17520 [Bryobacteraceae bacterium]
MLCLIAQSITGLINAEMVKCRFNCSPLRGRARIRLAPFLGHIPNGARLLDPSGLDHEPETTHNPFLDLLIR